MGYGKMRIKYEIRLGMFECAFNQSYSLSVVFIRFLIMRLRARNTIFSIIIKNLK
jgi:hypothetical protein